MELFGQKQVIFQDFLRKGAFLRGQGRSPLENYALKEGPEVLRRTGTCPDRKTVRLRLQKVNLSFYFARQLTFFR